MTREQKLTLMEERLNKLSNSEKKISKVLTVLENSKDKFGI